MNENQLLNVNTADQYFTGELLGKLGLLTITTMAAFQILSCLFLFVALENILG